MVPNHSEEWGRHSSADFLIGGFGAIHLQQQKLMLFRFTTWLSSCSSLDLDRKRRGAKLYRGG
jgi:hypothetical protein